MNGYHSKRPRFWRGLSAAIGLTGILLWPLSTNAQTNEETETQNALSWARVDFINNRVQFVPRQARARRARISDILGIGDALKTYAAAAAELRFNDGSMARIGERATFRFTPNTRNFQLTNGTALLLIPPGRGRTTIQTPNAVTGIQGSALFVRYIEETNTTIVGALTNNPEGPMILFNEDGTEQQALYANEIGVIKDNQIAELYQFDGELFWESSGLAEGFDYMEASRGADDLDGVRQEIQEAIASQDPLDGNSVIENPEAFSRPNTEEAPAESETKTPTEAENQTGGQTDEETDSTTNGGATNGGATNGGATNGGATEQDNSEPAAITEGSNEATADGSEAGSGGSEIGNSDGSTPPEAAEPGLILPVEETEEAVEPVIEFENSPAEEYLNQNGKPALETGGTNSLEPVSLTEDESVAEDPATDDSQMGSGRRPRPGSTTQPATETEQTTINRPSTGSSRPDNSDRPVNRPAISVPALPSTTVNDNVPLPATDLTIPILPDPNLPIGNGNNGNGVNGGGTGQVANPGTTTDAPTGGVEPLAPSALRDGDSGDRPDSNAEENNQPDSPVIDRNDETPVEAVPAVPSPETPDDPETVPATPEAEPTVPEAEPTDAVPSVPAEAEAVEETETPALVEDPTPEDATPVETLDAPVDTAPVETLDEPVEAEPVEAPTDSSPTDSGQVDPPILLEGSDEPVDAVPVEVPATPAEVEPPAEEVTLPPEPLVETPEMPSENLTEELPPETISGGAPNEDVATPETVIPEAVAPEAATPEEVAAPEEVAVPETVIPEATVSEEVVIPETVAPETAVPETTLPETTVPEVVEEVPTQLVDEAVPFPVEQVNDLPDAQPPTGTGSAPNSVGSPSVPDATSPSGGDATQPELL